MECASNKIKKDEVRPEPKRESETFTLHPESKKAIWEIAEQAKETPLELADC